MYTLSTIAVLVQERKIDVVYYIVHSIQYDYTLYYNLKSQI